MLNISSLLDKTLTNSNNSSLQPLKPEDVKFDDYLNVHDNQQNPLTPSEEEQASFYEDKKTDQVNAVNIIKSIAIDSSEHQAETAPTSLDHLLDQSPEKQHETIKDHLQSLRKGETIDAQDDDEKATEVSQETSNPIENAQSIAMLSALISQMQSYRF